MAMSPNPFPLTFKIAEIYGHVDPLNKVSIGIDHIAKWYMICLLPAKPSQYTLVSASFDACKSSIKTFSQDF